MSNKMHSLITMLLAAVILATGDRLPAWAQTEQPSAEPPELQRRCTTVALASESPALPLRLIQPYLERQADFRASRLVLMDASESADATITLSTSGERDTHIAVFSRISGRAVSALTLWTDYPGMVAADVMEQLKVVCPLSGAVASRQRLAPGPTAVGFRQPIAPGFLTPPSRPPTSSELAGTATDQAVEPGFSSSNSGDSQEENKCAVVSPDQCTCKVAKDAQGHGFKHAMGRVGFYAGQVLVDAATVAGYAAIAMAESAAMSGL
jgi:hypothetical protein